MWLNFLQAPENETILIRLLESMPYTNIFGNELWARQCCFIYLFTCACSDDCWAYDEHNASVHSRLKIKVPDSLRSRSRRTLSRARERHVFVFLCSARDFLSVSLSTWPSDCAPPPTIYIQRNCNNFSNTAKKLVIIASIFFYKIFKILIAKYRQGYFNCMIITLFVLSKVV